MKTIKLSDYTDKVLEYRKTGQAKGLDTGFSNLDQLISFKLGYSTYIVGYEAAGKTEIHFDILLNMSEKYGYKHGILSAEVGQMHEMIHELMSKYMKKDFFMMSEKEIFQAMNFLDEHFYAAPSDKDWDFKNIYEYFSQIEKDNGIKLQTTSIDPWNDLEEHLELYGGREDKYLTMALKHSRQVAEKNNWHNFIITHAKDSTGSMILKGVDGTDVHNTPLPTLQSFAGGRVWGRRAMNVMAIWRPSSVKRCINPETGLSFEENEARILVLKSKPKKSGKQGQCVLYLDWKTNRYYEKIDGFVKYAFQHKDTRNYMKPNLDFDTSETF